MYLGIDAGGTHTDAVLIHEGGIVASAKVRTRHDDLLVSVREVLTQLPANALKTVARVTLGTTLAVNAIVQGRTQPVGLVLSAGPGLAASRFAMGDHVQVVEGGLDHRGEEVLPLALGNLHTVAKAWQAKGVDVFAVVGKFSPRNPAHEQAIAAMLKPFARHIVQGHQLSGELHFPRRIATAYYSAAVWQMHTAFLDAVEEALAEAHIQAPIFLLKADGGAIALPLSRQQPAQTILSGPAASVMGIMALGAVPTQTTAACPTTSPAAQAATVHSTSPAAQPATAHTAAPTTSPAAQGAVTHMADAFLLDMGGTTTDIALFAQGFPVLARDGMRLQGPKNDSATALPTALPSALPSALPTVLPPALPTVLPPAQPPARSTLVRALAFSSIGIGGDSTLHRDAHGNIAVGPQRLGPAMAFGGNTPTLMDALIVAGHSHCGDVHAAQQGLSHWASQHGTTPHEAASAAIAHAMNTIAHAATALLERVNAHPVYTLAALLQDKAVCPTHIWLVGGPALAVQKLVQQTLQLPVYVPAHAAVANAIGAALTLPTASLDLFADTGRRIARIPLLDKECTIPPTFSVRDATTMAHDLLASYVQEHVIGTGATGHKASEPNTEDGAGTGAIETVSAQLFATLNDRGVGAKDIRISCQLTPGIVQRVTS